ncbi:MAG: hypothetical protein WBP85_12495 [Terracidiphilus sp.]
MLYDIYNRIALLVANTFVSEKVIPSVASDVARAVRDHLKDDPSVAVLHFVCFKDTAGGRHPVIAREVPPGAIPQYQIKPQGFVRKFQDELTEERSMDLAMGEENFIYFEDEVTGNEMAEMFNVSMEEALAKISDPKRSMN